VAYKKKVRTFGRSQIGLRPGFRANCLFGRIKLHQPKTVHEVSEYETDSTSTPPGGEKKGSLARRWRGGKAPFKRRTSETALSSGKFTRANRGTFRKGKFEENIAIAKAVKTKETNITPDKRGVLGRGMDLCKYLLTKKGRHLAISKELELYTSLTWGFGLGETTVLAEIKKQQ